MKFEQLKCFMIVYDGGDDSDLIQSSTIEVSSLDECVKSFNEKDGYFQKYGYRLLAIKPIPYSLIKNSNWELLNKLEHKFRENVSSAFEEIKEGEN